MDKQREYYEIHMTKENNYFGMITYACLILGWILGDVIVQRRYEGLCGQRNRTRVNRFRCFKIVG